MTRFLARCGGGATRVVVGPGALEELAEPPRQGGARRAFLLGDRRVLALHGERVRRALGPRLEGVHALPAGEGAKTPAAALAAWRRLARLGVRRDDLLVALGGGAALDAAGFLASTWMRGVSWVALPSTLLAQCDATLGGKTALDLPEGKNLVGTFHPPAAALVEPALLATLAEREYRAARFELLKVGWLGDAAVGKLALSPALAAREPAAVARAAARALGFKARVVQLDERDRGERRLLNLGHTFGHALEAASGYKLLHGEAVGVGLLAAACAARDLGLLGARGYARRRAQVLALEPPRVDAGILRQALGFARRDKKRSSTGPSELVLVLPQERGARVVEVEPRRFRDALGAAVAEIDRAFAGRRGGTPWTAAEPRATIR